MCIPCGLGGGGVKQEEKNKPEKILIIWLGNFNCDQFLVVAMLHCLSVINQISLEAQIISPEYFKVTQAALLHSSPPVTVAACLRCYDQANLLSHNSIQHCSTDTASGQSLHLQGLSIS